MNPKASRIARGGKVEAMKITRDKLYWILMKNFLPYSKATFLYSIHPFRFTEENMFIEGRYFDPSRNYNLLGLNMKASYSMRKFFLLRSNIPKPRI